ncbi:hypothetical protein Pla175_10100 [Pirellulimonas nuda]|uniref:Uncharacterized protein n=1 Tax=Pirellulimonas nuda TaxID=2528009 RepID=A0A518D858_9BACT|nr:hypothetical protein [Pirellulimonas nuda]QDU87644.1 hypothetical protein Pla175_10100 [Pirellulimonas nuda]
MSLNPLAPVTDYPSMLNRIFWFTSAATLGGVWLLRAHVAGIEAALAPLDGLLVFGEDRVSPVPAGSLAPALAVGLLTRACRIHAQLSDWLGIRERFDIDVILHRLAGRTGVDLTGVPDEALVRRRHRLMRDAFYSHTGGRHAVVDESLVHQALDAWSWFWVGLEAATVLSVVSLLLVACGAQAVGLKTLAWSIAFAVIGLPMLRNQCKRYAWAQVSVIVSDTKRAEQVRRAFDCLDDRDESVRLAA